MTETDIPFKITQTKIASLKPWQSNARQHSKKQIQQIADSIQGFGYTNPVLVDEDNQILASHGRVTAAQQIGLSSVPCALLAHMTADQKRAYVLADNKTALNARWDDELLAAELGALAELDLNFDIQLTGFSLPEIDTVIDISVPERHCDPRAENLPAIVMPRVAMGDIWALGPHRLVCGDSLDTDVVAELMHEEQASMVFCDPPLITFA